MAALLLLALSLGGPAGTAAVLARTIDTHPACTYNEDCKGEGRPACFAFFCVDLARPAGLQECRKGKSCSEGQLCFKEPYQSQRGGRRGVCVNSSEVECSAGSDCDGAAGQHCLGGRCAPQEYFEALKGGPCDRTDSSACQVLGFGRQCCLDLRAEGREWSAGAGATTCCDYTLGIVLPPAAGGTAGYDKATVERLDAALQGDLAEQLEEVCVLPELAGHLPPSCPPPATVPLTEPSTPAGALEEPLENGEERFVSEEEEVEEEEEEGAGHEVRSSCSGLFSSLAILATPLLLGL